MPNLFLYAFLIRKPRRLGPTFKNLSVLGSLTRHCDCKSRQLASEELSEHTWRRSRRLPQFTHAYLSKSLAVYKDLLSSLVFENTRNYLSKAISFSSIKIKINRTSLKLLVRTTTSYLLSIVHTSSPSYVTQINQSKLKSVRTILAMSKVKLEKSIKLSTLKPRFYRLWASQAEATFKVHKLLNLVLGREPNPFPQTDIQCFQSWSRRTRRVQTRPNPFESTKRVSEQV